MNYPEAEPRGICAFIISFAKNKYISFNFKFCFYTDTEQVCKIISSACPPIGITRSNHFRKIDKNEYKVKN